MLSGRLGIVGGVGPLAAAHFYQRVIQLSDATRDEEHLAVVLVSERVPSRIEHLMGEGPSPLPALAKAVTALSMMDVDAIALPSATTHAYHTQLSGLTDRPLFDLLAAVADELDESGLCRPVVLATRATVRVRLFDGCLPAGTIPVYPDRDTQSEIDRIIDGVKRGAPLEPLRQCLAELAARSAVRGDSVVLGCTELSLLRIESAAGRPVVDSSDALARRVLRQYAELAASSESRVGTTGRSWP